MYRVLTDHELQDENPGNSAGSYSDVLQACLNAMEKKGWRLVQVVSNQQEDRFFFHKEG